MIRKRNLRNKILSRNSNRTLYESIMRDVAKTVKRHLNENNLQSYKTDINILYDNILYIYKIKNIYSPLIQKILASPKYDMTDTQFRDAIYDINWDLIETKIQNIYKLLLENYKFPDFVPLTLIIFLTYFYIDRNKSLLNTFSIYDWNISNEDYIVDDENFEDYGQVIKDIAENPKIKYKIYDFCLLFPKALLRIIFEIGDVFFYNDKEQIDELLFVK